MATEEQCRERGGGERHFDGRKILAPVSGNPQPPSRYNLWYEFQNPRSLQVIMFTTLSENLTSHLELEVNITEIQIHL